MTLSLIRTSRRSARDAMLASISVRQEAGLDLHSPICAFDLCEQLGITVRFNDIASLEGMYERGHRPRIHLSSLRPLGRRHFNCAHELGHHIFRHGLKLHELTSSRSRKRTYDADEFLADTFAAFLLMPALGIDEAFALRGVTPEDASRYQVFAIACDFGVGYSTLVTHLVKSLGELSPTRAEWLLQWTPKQVRYSILAESYREMLMLLDEHSITTSVEVEVGSIVLLPRGTRILGDQLVYGGDRGHQALFEATMPGIARAIRPNPQPPLFVRVSKRAFVGLARFRHLGAKGDDNE
jgi:Zn-dependent peptidase ImmA (M78 family)